MNGIKLLLGCGLLSGWLACSLSGQESNENEPLPEIAEFVAGFEKQEGFLTFYWDKDQGKIWLEIQPGPAEFLFSHGLSSGLGANPVGLDRGQLGGQHVVHFAQVGPKVLMVERNLRYRATSESLAEQRAVAESFATSILWGGTIAAESAGKVVVDATELLFSDWHHIVSRLKTTEQGDFALDENRSAVYLPRCKAFPDNTELEATLTFTGQQPGPLVRQTTPTPQAVSLRSHYSFIRLPNEGYRPRAYDPRVPSIAITFADYSQPIDAELEQRWIIRHRLEKKDPSADLSEPVEPIVYYVDNGVPEPIRQALIDGASWWNEAFEAIGFKDAFQVRVLPEDADPMDVRYNTIQWVHRSTRGWSYGGSVIDPRTGEILKGHVSLGSLRVRQDRMIIEGLTPQFTAAACACCGVAGTPGDSHLAVLDDDLSATDIALARIRQLSAHEVGHTLGFVHNFAASTYDNRASVMDYPAPLIKIVDGKIDLSEAYGTGIGTWDKFAVAYAYSQFGEGVDEAAELQRLIKASIERGMLFISDADARPAGAAHPLANLWDNGQNPTDELLHLLRVRELALADFGQQNIPVGTPMSRLTDTFVPIYLLHRYQIDATAKMIGGAVYTYAVAGDNQIPVQWVSSTEQMRATNALLEVLRPENLEISPDIEKLLPPAAFADIHAAERFSSSTSPIFDPLAAAESLTDLTLQQFLHPHRVSRVAHQSQVDFGVREYLWTVIDSCWPPVDRISGDRRRQISRIVRWRLNQHLMRLAESESASPESRSMAVAGLRRVDNYCRQYLRVTNHADRHFAEWLRDDIQRFLARPRSNALPERTLQTPAGSPIGN